MANQIIAASKFYGRPEYYNDFFESSEFKLELHDLTDYFGTKYQLLVQYPDRLYIHTFEDKKAAIGAYFSECKKHARVCVERARAAGLICSPCLEA